MTTKELLNIIEENVGKIVEAQLVLQCAFATHFIFFDKAKNIMIDEGIDGIPYSINMIDFDAMYKNAKWRINQIV